MSEVNCKKCKGNSHTKKGFVRGKQRYICKRCGSSFVEGDTRGKVPLSLKLQDLKLYISGLSLNRIAHLPCVRRMIGKSKKWILFKTDTRFLIDLEALLFP